MATATMTTKGQVTIPVAVRRALRLEPGTVVDFIELEDGSFALRPATSPLAALRGAAGIVDLAIPLPDMDEAIARGAAEAMR